MIGENNGRYREGLRLQAIVAMDRKGQVLLSKHLRDKARIKPCDKLIIMVSEKEGEVHCILLLKTEKFAETVTRLMNSVLE